MLTYIQVIGMHCSTVQCSSSGNGSVYETLVHEGGDTIPPKADLDALILSETQNMIWEQIKAKRDAIRAGGVQVGSSWFHSDDSSRIQLISLVMLGAGLPTGIQWKTMTGSFITMTPTLAQQIFGAFLLREPAIYATAEQHKANMLASATPDIYDYSTGWPAIYIE